MIKWANCPHILFCTNNTTQWSALQFRILYFTRWLISYSGLDIPYLLPGQYSSLRMAGMHLNAVAGRNVNLLLLIKVSMVQRSNYIRPRGDGSAYLAVLMSVWSGVAFVVAIGKGIRLRPKKKKHGAGKQSMGWARQKIPIDGQVFLFCL